MERLIAGINSLEWILAANMFLNPLLVMILKLLHIIMTISIVGLLELQQTMLLTKSSLKIEEKTEDAHA